MLTQLASCKALQRRCERRVVVVALLAKLGRHAVEPLMAFLRPGLLERHVTDDMLTWQASGGHCQLAAVGAALRQGATGIAQAAVAALQALNERSRKSR